MLVADGLSRIDGTLGELDEFRVNSARVRLRGLDDLLVAAAGGLSTWSRAALNALAVFPVMLGVAAGGRALGLADGWMIAAALLAALPAFPLGTMGIERLNRLADRRRLARAPRPERPFRVTVLTPARLLAVPEELLQARVRLVSAALRQVPPAEWTVARLTEQAADDRSVARIAHADLILCQAIDYLELYLAEQSVGRTA